MTDIRIIHYHVINIQIEHNNIETIKVDIIIFFKSLVCKKCYSSILPTTY